MTHDEEKIDILPTKKKELFAADEVVHGKCLGHGGFADVYEVRSFRPHHEQDRTRSMSNVDLRRFFEEHAKDDNGDCKYAIKCLHPELEQEGQRKILAAEKDIASEAALLATFDHPNIVKVYGYAGDDEHPNGKTGPLNSYFLIMDKLSGTLDDRIARWKWQQHRQMITPVLHLLDHNFHANKKKELLVERLEVAYEIACALAYLHDERIVYRDLKPSNIGFNAEGQCKLFDFGLSRHLPSVSQSKLMNETYIMSSKVGSCPYMAPEVWKKQPYNEKVDVYSFALILWEILALEKAFIEYAHDKAVLAEHIFVKGDRPPIGHWPVKIQQLLSEAWSQDMNERPTMQQACIVLKETIAFLRGGDFAGLQPKRRESRHILTGVKRLLHRDTKKPVTTSS